MAAANLATLEVTSHVGRDLLQSAEVFKTEKHVVWEYVSNGLQYIEPGTQPEVRVTIGSGKRKRIVITDNGRGMRLADLRNFFVMHGENVDRKAGRAGRGRFGTGKSAAFGIADCLTVTTVRDGKRTKVELRRSQIEKMSQGDPVPVKVLEAEVPTDETNGTTVEITEIAKKTLDQKGVIGYIERHILHWPNATVWVNHHQCEFEAPAVNEERRFSTEGTAWEDTLGKVELVVKVAKGPLADELQGIAVLSNGAWHESTLAGLERKEFANYIFGEIDVPALDSDTSTPSPFDLSRSMQLNPANETVAAIHQFIGARLSEILRELGKAERDRRKSEEAKKLQKEADRIASIINNDFSAFRTKLQKVQSKGVGGTDMHPGEIPSEGDGEILSPGGDIPATRSGEGGPGHGDGEIETPGGNDYPKGEALEEDEAGEVKAKRTPAKRVDRAPRGGFSVEFREMGESDGRAKYDPDDRTIYVNLDHPQVVAARGTRGVEDPVFRRLAYEVAFAEYALGLAYVMDEEGHYLETWEPIRDVRETIDRVTRAAAGLYSEGASS